jgi:peptide deformylase
MINPVIAEKRGAYETEEGCLSLAGVRKTIRYDRITVRYLDMKFSEHTQTFSGYIAQIIQHECDHLEGILI